MFEFHYQVTAQDEVRRDAEVNPTTFQKLLSYAADAITEYWFAFVPLIIVGCIGCAALIPKRRSEGEPPSQAR